MRAGRISKANVHAVEEADKFPRDKFRLFLQDLMPAVLNRSAFNVKRERFHRGPKAVAGRRGVWRQPCDHHPGLAAKQAPVVAAPIIGALKAKYIDDAITALSGNLPEHQLKRLELPYTPRMDYQGVSDPVMLARAVEAAPGFKSSAA